MARRLGVSRDTVRRDLDEIDQGVAELDEIDQPDAVADAGSAAGTAESAPVADAAPQVGEVA
ncbi:DeoR family transcriptional regulator, partial [Streptomyces sp. C1-2]|nr:DeoR family transcriptional regulator [Streptomyces sp. C1-2]